MSRIETVNISAADKKVPISKNPLPVRAAYHAGSEIASVVAGPFIRYWLETIDKGATVEYAPDFDDKFAEAVEDNCLIIYEANHASIYDADILGIVNEETREGANTTKTLLPMAKSQMTGDQGFWPFVIYKSTKKLLEDRHLHSVPTTTSNDKADRKLSSNSDEFTTGMTNGLNNGFAIAVLPEASVKGGRINPDTGEINGMIPFDPDVLRMNYILAKRKHKNLAIVPISIRDSNHVFDPNSKFPKRNAFLAGFHMGDPRIVSVYVGAPLRTDRELKEFVGRKDWKGGSDYVGRDIAKHLDIKQQGVYRVNSTSL